MMNISNKNLINYSIISIAPLCWAGDVVLAKGISEIMHPIALAFWRWMIAFLMLIPFTCKHIKEDWSIVKVNWKTICLLSIIGMSAFIALIYTAVQTTTAINTALIQTSMPGTIVIFCFFLYGEKISFFQFSGLIMCFIGAAYVILQGCFSNIFSMTFVRGDVLMIVASIMYGLYSALLQKMPKIHPLSFLTLTSLAGAIGLLFPYIYEIYVEGFFQINVQSITGVLYVALFPSVVAYLSWNRGVYTIGANKTGIFVTLIPVFASILAIFFLGESLKEFHVIGIIMIFIGMIVFNTFDRKEIKI